MDDVVERIYREDDESEEPRLPEYLIVVSESKEPHAWTQPSGAPGFVEWRIFDSLGMTADGRLVFDAASIDRRDVYSYDEASPVAEGSVKWDGCANFSAGELEGVQGGVSRLACLVHVCSGEQLATFGRALVRAYELSLEAVGGGLDD